MSDGSLWSIREVGEQDAAFAALLEAAQTLKQAKYVTKPLPYAEQNRFVAAFCNGGDKACVGFLRFVIFPIGRDAGRPVITVDREPLREGYVEAFGVLPTLRRRGIGQQLQETAIEICRAQGCYQIRSRSPVTSVENYQLTLKMGYAVHPSHENDSYYFIKVLRQGSAT